MNRKEKKELLYMFMLFVRGKELSLRRFNCALFKYVPTELSTNEIINEFLDCEEKLNDQNQTR